MNSDQIPLQLPWLARQAGLSVAKAKALWLEAAAYAEKQCGNRDLPEFPRLAMEKLRSLINAESARLNAMSPMRAWARLQRHCWSLQLTWLEAGNTVTARTLRALSGTPRACNG